MKEERITHADEEEDYIFEKDPDIILKMQKEDKYREKMEKESKERNSRVIEGTGDTQAVNPKKGSFKGENANHVDFPDKATPLLPHGSPKEDLTGICWVCGNILNPIGRCRICRCESDRKIYKYIRVCVCCGGKYETDYKGSKECYKCQINNSFNNIRFKNG